MKYSRISDEKKFELKKNQFNLKFNSIYCSRFLISLKKYLTAVGVEPEMFHLHNCDADHLAIRQCLSLNLFYIFKQQRKAIVRAMDDADLYSS